MNKIETIENDLSILKFKLYTCECTTVEGDICSRCVEGAEQIKILEVQLTKEQSHGN